MDEYGSRCSNQEWLDRVYEKLLVKMRAECARIGTKIPYTTDRDGTYHDVEERWGLEFWTNGFWPGMLWQMYGATGEEDYRRAAVGAEERLAALLDSPEKVDHDVGFCFFCLLWRTIERQVMRMRAGAACWRPICWRRALT